MYNLKSNTLGLILFVIIKVTYDPPRGATRLNWDLFNLQLDLVKVKVDLNSNQVIILPFGSTQLDSKLNIIYYKL